MFQRQQQQPQQPQQQPEAPKFTPSDAFDRLQTYSNSFFLFACTAGGILAVNVARVSPSYFWLIITVTIAAIVTLAFFPNASNQQVRRIGILAVAVGILLGNWEFLSTFKMQQIHIAIAVGVVVVALAAIGAAGGRNE
ncbi:hypothetical protein [Microcoleus sp. herbarium14]|uniref:hypothetical protein n=1 Tax=Microcoleus sp. herbarium14 TaxID=3055439 RepID=UPI002FD09560